MTRCENFTNSLQIGEEEE